MAETVSLTTKRRTLGQVLVCLGCCCGRTERGFPAVPADWLKAKWKEHKLAGSIQLTISGCLGPCDLANVVCVVTPAETIWLGGLSGPDHYESLLQWAQESALQQRLAPLPLSLSTQVFDRFRGEPLAALAGACAEPRFSLTGVTHDEFITSP